MGLNNNGSSFEPRKKTKNNDSSSSDDGHFNPLGIRKGSGTYYVATIVEPPPIPSVTLRGEWSTGKVYEVSTQLLKWCWWLKENLVGIVKNAMEERATENGNTTTFVTEKLAAATAAAKWLNQGGTYHSCHTLGGIFFSRYQCRLHASASLPRSQRLEARIYPSSRIKFLMRRDRRSTSSVRLIQGLSADYILVGQMATIQGSPSYVILDGNGKQMHQSGLSATWRMATCHAS